MINNNLCYFIYALNQLVFSWGKNPSKISPLKKNRKMIIIFPRILLESKNYFPGKKVANDIDTTSNLNLFKICGFCYILNSLLNTC